MRKVDVAVIGAGQAGLATSFYLSQSGIEHVVLDRAVVADSWRSRRWDSFTLNIPNWSFTLPGFRYDGQDPDGFMTREEIVERVARYAGLINAPVEEGIDVTALKQIADGTYLLTTTSGTIGARAVVVATGAYQREHRPANQLDASILQLSSDHYSNPGELEDGGVLVVGSGQSGCQIVEDLVADGRRVWLAAGVCGWIPRRYRGRDNVAWRMDMRVFDETVEQLGSESRRACPPIQTGVGRDRDLNLRTLRDAGVTLTGRFLDGYGTTVRLADDLPQNAARSDEFARRFMATPDMWLAMLGSSLTAVLAAIAAFKLSMPDSPRAWAWLPLPAALLWIAASGLGCLRDVVLPGTRMAPMEETMECLAIIVALSVPFALLMFAMLREAFSLLPGLTATIAGLAVAAASATLLNLFHPFDAAAVDLLVHAIAVALVVVVIRFFGRRLWDSANTSKSA